jgi:ribonuclease P protein component
MYKANEMKKRDRVKGNFDRILKVRVSREGGLTIFAAKGRGRIGVAVSKSVKGAVNRNRIKRQLRVYADKNILGKYPDKDVILVAGAPKFSKKAVRI